MFVKGLALEAMQTLTRWKASQLEPYVIRATEQTVLTQAFNLDKA